MNNKVLILYTTKYGSTERYAGWIHEAVESELAPFDRSPALQDYDTVVLGGFVRAGKIKVAAKFLIDNWEELKEKSVVLFVVGAAPPEFPEWERLYQEQVPEPIRRQIMFFTLQGRLDLNELDLADRMTMQFGILIETDPMIKEQMKRGVDGVRRENAQPIIDLLRSRIAEPRPG